MQVQGQRGLGFKDRVISRKMVVQIFAMTQLDRLVRCKGNGV